MQLVRYILLGPLALLYGAVTTVRNWAYDLKLLPIYRSPLKVVSVGNLTAGGNSKTPLCIYLAKFYQQRGKKVVIVSRGYGGKAVGPYLVSPNDPVDLVGDEPAMMSRFYGLTVVICAKRKDALRKIEREGLGDVVILDDGFQHRAVARDLDIVAVNCATEDAIAEFNAGELLPLGRFRERRGPGLKRADLLVLSTRTLSETQRGALSQELRALPETLLLVNASFETKGVKHATTESRLDPCEIGAFCAIANPEGFFRSLEFLGYTLKQKLPFPDHHTFSDRDLSQIFESEHNLPWVCTEKDCVKVPVSYLPKVFVLKVELAISESQTFSTRLVSL